MLRLVALALWAPVVFGATTAADLARGLRENTLDPEECYRVRELTLVRQDARLYLTDGYLMFARTAAGTRTGAIFTAEAEGGDGELLLMPPNRSERRSLASYAGSPNLDEHLKAAVLLFTDDTYSDLLQQIRANPFNKKAPEMGTLVADRWTPVLRNLTGSFESRMVLDLLAGAPNPLGFFVATIIGRKLGNFDFMYDPRSAEQILVGQVTSRENRSFFDIWTSFEARAFRTRSRETGPEFRISDYRIEAILAPDLLLSVITRIKVRPRETARALPFDIARSMQITALTVDGHPAEVLQRESLRANLIAGSGNEIVVAVPPEPLEAGREYEFEFRHEGRVIFQAGNHVYYVSARSNWYPNRGLQFANYDITFRYPRDLDLVSAGEVVSEKIEGDWRIARRRVSTPIRMAGFNLGRYNATRITRGPYDIQVFANRTVERALEPPRNPLPLPPLYGRQRRPDALVLPPVDTQPNPPSRLNLLAGDVASALEFMSARFGPPALRVLTVSPVPGRFGQGFPGLIYLSTLSYLRGDERAVSGLTEHARFFFAEFLQAHETAHQWWGNVVTTAGYHDEWLMEALASYSALLYLEKHKGPRSVDSILDDYRAALLARTSQGTTTESAGPIVMGARLENSLTPQAWRDIVYGKGSWIIHMLRRRMSDERFLAMLAELRRRFESKTITTEQFRTLAAEFLPPRDTDPKLETFFDQWVYDIGIPALKLTYSLKGKAPALKLTGTVTQSEVGEDFSVPVPVEIQFGRGINSVRQIVRTATGPVQFTVALKQPPVKVLLDPALSVLRR